MYSKIKSLLKKIGNHKPDSKQTTIFFQILDIKEQKTENRKSSRLITHTHTHTHTHTQTL